MLVREAVYRALGEALAQVEQVVDFSSWYRSELRGILLASLQVWPRVCVCARARAHACVWVHVRECVRVRVRTPASMCACVCVCARAHSANGS